MTTHQDLKPQKDSKSNAHDQTEATQFIKYQDKVQFVCFETKHFVSDPVIGLDQWDYAKCQGSDGIFVLTPEKPTEKILQTGDIHYGCPFRIKSLKPNRNTFDFMYCTPFGYVAFGEYADSPEQLWKFVKYQGTDEIKTGNQVMIENLGYEESRLYERDENLFCGNCTGVWQVRIK